MSDDVRNEKEPEVVYTTENGVAYRGDSRLLLESDRVGKESVDLIVTSPPFALTREKDYSNRAPDEYIEWFETFIPGFHRVLNSSGSLVVDIGGAYLPGKPQRATYHFELAVMLADYFEMCQEFYWFNPAKLPSPAQWVNIERVRVKDSVNLVLWFAKDASNTKANNKRVLKRYSESMQSLLKNGYQVRKRPSNHDISDQFSEDQGGAIPPNLLGFVPDGEQLELAGEGFEVLFDNILAIANTASRTKYLNKCRELGIKPHSARFPVGLPAFMIEFLTESGDVVCDPFAGSNATGEAAEKLGRQWISCDLDLEDGEPAHYVRTSAFRFDDVELAEGFEEVPTDDEWRPEAYHAGPSES